uniref:Uncharacterized protein n=1 Tax=Photinus pyralis TaxID=7054 RepID=A0A1Y1MBE5_PHOPY
MAHLPHRTSILQDRLQKLKKSEANCRKIWQQYQIVAKYYESNPVGPCPFSITELHKNTFRTKTVKINNSIFEVLRKRMFEFQQDISKINVLNKQFDVETKKFLKHLGKSNTALWQCNGEKLSVVKLDKQF